ncbi:MAG: PilZ domain-containing protein [Candidatus Hydrogenedentales bacterium]|jgi:c-di-GMP-binding flagellar brake protein YcgR
MRNTESFLSVGLNALLSPYSGKESTLHYRVVLRGWQAGNWIWLEVPEDCEKLPLLLEDHMCILRFMHDGQACAFTARILQALNSDGATRFSGMRVSWPDTVKTVEVRRSPRVAISCPCLAILPNKSQARCAIRDLSEGGCSIAWQESSQPPTNGQMHLTFTLPGGIAVDRVLVTVRAAREGAGGWTLGCQFGSMDEIVYNNIRLALVASLESMRASQIERAVILESSPDAARLLVAALREERFEVVVVSHLIDAAFWLGSARPHAFFIGFNQKELPVEQLCRIVRETPSFGRLPLFVYGGEDAELGRKVKKEGATAYFTTAAKARGALKLIARDQDDRDAAVS